MGHLIVTLNKVAGEKHMKSWLAENGYSSIIKENLNSADYALIATGQGEKIMVQVRAFTFPNKPVKLSEFELDVLTGRAKKFKLVPYVAYIILDESSNLHDDIIWERQ